VNPKHLDTGVPPGLLYVLFCLLIVPVPFSMIKATPRIDVGVDLNEQLVIEGIAHHEFRDSFVVALTKGYLVE
jgi:hypothetical protein